MASRYGKKASDKVEAAMHERKRGTLRSGGSGKKVTSRKQAIAIGLSEARREGGKVPPEPKSSSKKSASKKSGGAKKSSSKKSTSTKSRKSSSSKKSSSTKSRKSSSKKSSSKKSSSKKK